MRPADFISISERRAAPPQLFIAQADSPFGPLLLAADTQGITHIRLNEDKKAINAMQASMPHTEFLQQASPHHAAALSHFTDTPQKLCLHLKGTAFQLSVWRALLDIPYGETTSYQAIAIKIGKPKANRAVGSAVGRNPIFFAIPCHRVLATGGGLGGYYWGLPLKQQILEFENARIASL